MLSTRPAGVKRLFPPRELRLSRLLTELIAQAEADGDADLLDQAICMKARLVRHALRGAA